MSNHKKVLIVAFQFCPKGQIGTRRWSKFAKYLAKEGYRVFILAGRYTYRDKVNWCQDVEDDPNIHITRIPMVAPSYVLQPQRSLGVKILDRLLQRTIYPRDYGQHWHYVFLKHARKLLDSHKISNVIVSGPPFSVVKDTMKLKATHPDVKIIVDFRDQWSITTKDVTQRRAAYLYEKDIFAKVDAVILNTQEMFEQYQELHPSVSSIGTTIHNGYDPEDYDTKSVNSISEQQLGLSLIHAGTVPDDSRFAVLLFCRALLNLGENFWEEINLRVDSYGSEYQLPAQASVQEQDVFQRVFHMQGRVPPIEMQKQISHSHYGLVFVGKHFRGRIATKTYEYMGQHKSILYIGPPGEAANILNIKKQFVADLTEESIKQALERLKKDYIRRIKQKASFNAGVDYLEYSYPQLTQQLLMILENEHTS
jgi:hypothetical protein